MDNPPGHKNRLFGATSASPGVTDPVTGATEVIDESSPQLHSNALRIVQSALTFDDVLLLPGYSEVLPKDVSTRTRLSRNIELNIPLLSAAMDTVTEARMAIALAQEGGMGIIHKNMSPRRQAQEVSKVKKYEAGIIRNPITIGADDTLSDLLKLTDEHGISGVPVVRPQSGALVGIVTNRDVRFESRLDTPVSRVMTRKKDLVTVGENPHPDEVRRLLHQHRIEKVLVVDKAFKLCGMITVKDMDKSSRFPSACKDDLGRLRVGACVGPAKGGTSGVAARVEALVEADVDLIVLDTAHGHSKGVLKLLRWIKANYPDLEVMGGNVATADGALALADAGADAVKVGIGPGSICTTRVVSGVGVPQITAVAEVARALSDTSLGVIADGGIRYSGDIAKAIVAGAHGVMVGSLLAGTDEAPGDVELFQGRSYKSYRGMGSLGAMSGQDNSADRYFQSDRDAVKLVPEGVEGRVPYRGAVSPIIGQLMGGVRAAMGYTGSADMEVMRTVPQFSRITQASTVESHVHDVTITKEPPNYPLR